MRVLVLGASGLLGHTLTPYLRRAGFDVVAHGNSNMSGADVHCDATDAGQLRSLIDSLAPDFIVNLIALTNVDRCNGQIDLAYKLNVGVVENITAAVARLPAGKGRLIQISTDHVYDKDEGTSAENETIMRNVYALSKYAGDLAAQACESVVLRTSFFGPGKTSTRESLSDAIRKTLATGNPFFGFDDCYFSPLSSAQLAEEIVRVMRHWISGVYNLGATTGLSKYEFAVQTAVAFGLDAELIHPRSLASYTGLVSRPFNMMMNVDAYQAAFDTKLPDLEYLIEKTGREPQ